MVSYEKSTDGPPMEIGFLIGNARPDVFHGI